MKKNGIVWLTVLLTVPALALSVSAAGFPAPDAANAPDAEILAVERPDESETEESFAAAPQTDDEIVRLSLLCAVSGLGICMTKKKSKA